MLKKPLNKILSSFLEASFSENPLFFKKLNKKGKKLNTLSNKKGLTDRIRKIEKNIIKQKIKEDEIDKKTRSPKIFSLFKPSTASLVSLPLQGRDTTYNEVTVDHSKKINNFIKPSFQRIRRFCENSLKRFKDLTSFPFPGVGTKSFRTSFPLKGEGKQEGASPMRLFAAHRNSHSEKTEGKDILQNIVITEGLGLTHKKITEEGYAGGRDTVSPVKGYAILSPSFVTSYPQPSEVLSKYIFSLEQLKAEFDKKQSQHLKSSHFKNLLKERKKLTLFYGRLGEKQIQKYVLQSKQLDGNFDENFIKIVESRLDVALVRICFFPTILGAKQWINHKHIYVNNKVITLPGYQLKQGDIISLSPEKKGFLKEKIIKFLALKIKIRSRHYNCRLSTFYTVIKNCINYQNKKLLQLILVASQKATGKEYALESPGSVILSAAKRLDPFRGLFSPPSSIPFFKKTLYKILLQFQKNSPQRKDSHLTAVEGRNPSRELNRAFGNSRQSGVYIFIRKSKLLSYLYLLPKIFDSVTKKGYTIGYPFEGDRTQVIPEVRLLSLLNKGSKGSEPSFCEKSPVRFKEGTHSVVENNSFLKRTAEVKKNSKNLTQLLLPFLKVRNLLTSARPLRQRFAGLRISGMKPLNIEVCYKNMVAIFLYKPQKVALPISLDLHLIAKKFQ